MDIKGNFRVLMLLRTTLDYNKVLFNQLPEDLVYEHIFSFAPLAIFNASLVSAQTRDFFNRLATKIITSSQNVITPNFPISTFLEIYIFTRLPSVYVNRSRFFTTDEREHDFTIACSHGDLEGVKRILSMGVDIDCRRNTAYEAIDNAYDLQRNLSPIELAAVEGHPEVVSFLLDNGAYYSRRQGVDKIDNSTIFDIVADQGLSTRRLECLKIICRRMVFDSDYIPFYWSYRVVVAQYIPEDTLTILNEVVKPIISLGTCINIDGLCPMCYSDINKENKTLYFTEMDSSSGVTSFLCRACTRLNLADSSCVTLVQ